MKKTFLFLAALCMTVAANATIFRVSNVTGSSAPYTSLDDAQGAASEGDTIMVDGSSDSYENFTIKKRITLIGPGYWLLSNNSMNEVLHPAVFLSIEVNKEAEATVIEGVYVTHSITTNAPKTVVKRCRIFDESYTGGGLFLNAKNCVAHQNIVDDIKTKAFYVGDYFDQITNNIILGGIGSIGGSYIAYNTFIGYEDYNDHSIFSTCFGDVINSTIEYNILPNEIVDTNGWNDIESNNFQNNYLYGPLIENQLLPWRKDIKDTEVKEVTLTHTEAGYGAFAGNDPYVISGIPAGPVITDMVIPTTVEMGSKLNVTIKVDISR